MNEKLEKLLSRATDREKKELIILHNATDKTMLAFHSDPSAANKRNWDAAQKGFDEIFARLWEKYFHTSPESDDRQVFKNRLAAVKWLVDNGYKIKKSKLYKDVAAGLLKMETDGTITIESIRRYLDHPEAGICRHIQQAEAGSDHEIEEYHRRTAIAKMKKTELEAEKLKIEMEREQGMWIARADLEMEMAGRAAVLEQGLRNWIQFKSDAWIHMAGGDIMRAGEVRATMNSELTDLLNQYSRSDVFEVIFEDDPDQ